MRWHLYSCKLKYKGKGEYKKNKEKKEKEVEEKQENGNKIRNKTGQFTRDLKGSLWRSPLKGCFP
jgi:hypothetical protein